MYSSIRQLYCCDITDIRRVPPEKATYTKLMKLFEKSVLIGLSKFAQTFAVRFLKSSSIHPICINAWGSFSFKYSHKVALASACVLCVCVVYSYVSCCISVCLYVCVCVCVSVYLPENEDLVPTSYIQIVDAPPNVDVHGLGR